VRASAAAQRACGTQLKPQTDGGLAYDMADSMISGSCLCGTVRFGVRLPSLFCGHCHCSMCRRNHGAGFVTWFAVPRAQLEVQAGARELRRYSSSTHGSRSFCGRCGSSLFCESEKHPEQVDIPLANVDAPIDRLPQVHVYFDDRAPWVEVSDDLPRLGGKSGMEPLGGKLSDG
jgi:hypothetical protein